MTGDPSAIGPMLGVDDPDPSALSAERGTQRAAPRSRFGPPDGVNLFSVVVNQETKRPPSNRNTRG